MKKDEFRKWLKEVRKVCAHTANLRVSNCKKVETAHGNLDVHYIRDKGESLLSLLSYSTYDEKQKTPARHKVHIGGVIRTNTSTLRQAVGHYMAFCLHRENPMVIEPIEKYL
jgi:hypothetical protein